MIEINLNILTQQGLLDFNSFTWVKYQKNKLKLTNFIDIKNKVFDQDISDFDMCRICELEIMNKGWQCQEKQENNSILNKVKFLFEPTFLIQKMFWDDVGYDLFKFYLIAACKGIFKHNKLGTVIHEEALGLKIKVVDYMDPIMNEVKKNGLIYERNDNFQVRIGDIVVFYISKNKTVTES